VSGRFPILEPSTGEVLALDEDERREVAELNAAALVHAHAAMAQAREAAERARAILALVLEPGDALALEGGWAVTVKPGAPARRAVNRQALQQHAEALAPLELAPREVTSVEYPGVAQLTTTKARTALARLGLTPEAFLLAGEPGPPSVVVIPPEETL
jgi:hypothetical protein